MKEKIKNYLKGLPDDQLATLYQEFLAVEDLSQISLEDVKIYVLTEIGSRFLEENVGSRFIEEEKPKDELQTGDTLWYVNVNANMVERCDILDFDPLAANSFDRLTVEFEDGSVDSFDDNLYNKRFFCNKTKATEVLNKEKRK